MASDVAVKIRDQLTDDLRGVVEALGERALHAITDRVGGITERLTDYAQQGGGPGLTAAITGAKGLAEGDSPVKSMLKAGLAGGKEKVKSMVGGGDGNKGGATGKVTVIIETVDVGVPVRVAYNQWTMFGDFPSFMKKVEKVDQESDEKLNWKAQIFWSHRSWESTIIRQIPDRLIHWRSKGAKGSVDGTVSFHEIGSDLTRILVVLEYHPQGLFEQTGNMWRAQGRRARLELKHFVRHVMTQTALDPDSVEGWRGEIDDSQVVKDHETALREEQEGEQPEGEENPEDVEEDNGQPHDEDEEEPDEEESEEEEPEEEEPPQSRRRQPPARRRQQPAEEQPRAESQRSRPGRRGTESPRRPVVRRRQEENER